MIFSFCESEELKEKKHVKWSGQCIVTPCCCMHFCKQLLECWQFCEIPAQLNSAKHVKVVEQGFVLICKSFPAKMHEKLPGLHVTLVEFRKVNYAYS